MSGYKQGQSGLNPKWICLFLPEFCLSFANYLTWEKSYNYIEVSASVQIAG
jgi:hypothetical protein